MVEPETITLPKSGVVLTKVQDMWWASDRGPFHLRLRMATHDDIPWCCEVYGLTGRVFRWARTLEDCVSDLDAEVMKIRAALLPPGAIVVSDTEETRERIARKLNATHREFAQTPNSLCYDCDCPDQDDNAPPPFDEMCDGCKSSQLEEASAVLAALLEARP